MTHSMPPVDPQPVPPYVPPVPANFIRGGGGFPPPKRGMSTGKKLALILSSIVVGVLACGGLVAYAVGSTPKPAAQSDGATIGAPVQDATTPAASPAAPKWHTPTAADFTLTPKITAKQCFGSAGCNVQFTVDLVYKGLKAQPSSSWDITYEATGLSDALTVTIRLDFDQTGLHGSYTDDEQFVETKTTAAKPALTITSITPA